MSGSREIVEQIIQRLDGIDVTEEFGRYNLTHLDKPYVYLLADADPGEVKRRAGGARHRELDATLICCGKTPAQCRWCADKVVSLLEDYKFNIPGRACYAVTVFSGLIVADGDLPDKVIYSISVRIKLRSVKVG